MAQGDVHRDDAGRRQEVPHREARRGGEHPGAGRSPGRVRPSSSRMTPVLPKGVEAITGQGVGAENTDIISSQFLNIFTTFLLVFSGIALLVATFSIHNTFAIVVAQRTGKRPVACPGRLPPPGHRLVPGRGERGRGDRVGRRPRGRHRDRGRPAGAVPPPSGSPSPRAAWWSALCPCCCRSRSASWSAWAPRCCPPYAPDAPRRSPRCARPPSTGPGLAGRAIVGAALAVLAVEATLTGVLVSPSLWLAGLGAVLALAAFVVLGPVASSAAVRDRRPPRHAARCHRRPGPAQRAAQPERTAATASALMIGVAVVAVHDLRRLAEGHHGPDGLPVLRGRRRRQHPVLRRGRQRAEPRVGSRDRAAAGRPVRGGPRPRGRPGQRQGGR